LELDPERSPDKRIIISAVNISAGMFQRRAEAAPKTGNPIERKYLQRFIDPSPCSGCLSLGSEKTFAVFASPWRTAILYSWFSLPLPTYRLALPDHNKVNTVFAGDREINA